MAANTNQLLNTAAALRQNIGGDFHDSLMQSIYTDAEEISSRAVTRDGEKGRLRFRPQAGSTANEPCLGLPTDAADAHGRLLAYDCRGQHSLTDAGYAAAGDRLWCASQRGDDDRHAHVAVRLPDRRSLSCHGLGDCRNAAADGDLLPVVHACWKTSVICRGWRSTWIDCSSARAPTASSP